MDLHQLSPQIGAMPASGELSFGAGTSLGSPSQESGFSSVLQAASQRIDARREARSRAFQAERENRPSGTTQPVHRSLSSKTEGSRRATRPAAQAEHENRPPGTTQAVHRSLLHKAAGATETESRLPHTETDDEPSTTASDVPTPLLDEPSSRTDTESHSLQAESGDDPSPATLGAAPLLVSLAGAPMVMPAATADSTQNVTGSDIVTSEVGGRVVVSESPMSQPAIQPAEGGASAVPSENRGGDVVEQQRASTMGNTFAIVAPPAAEEKPSLGRTDTDIPGAVQSDRSLPLSVQESPTAESMALNQGVPIKGQWEREIPQAPVLSGQDAAQGQAPVQPVPVPAQPTRRNGDGSETQPERSPMQPILSEAEPSLRQKNTLESSDSHTAEALSGHTKVEGQGLNTESDGQRKEEGMKWLAHVDLQSVDISSRRSQEPATESLDSGPQYLSYQQGQGGAASTIKSASAPAVPPTSQTNSLSPDTETAPIPLTHAVQFDLEPADFGQLRVRLVMSEHTVHTHLSTDRAELGQILTGRQEQLSTQLSAAGLDLGRFQVQVNQERASHSGQEWPSQAHGGTSHQQRDARQQEHSPETPVSSQKRTGVLSLFA